ncbi:MAG: OsmC family protein [Cyanobacteria bacterium]|nr:OsmC family protein [Cyanobacteriota bacterium]
MSGQDKIHSYPVSLRWTGNRGQGTSSYRAYDRDYTISIPGKPDLRCSSDPTFRGDPSRSNPEEQLVAALSGCHMLWYLHLCAVNQVVVLNYSDEPVGTMAETAAGGRFTAVVLRPRVVLAAESDRAVAARLHQEAHHACFIANSVNFPVACEPTFEPVESAENAQP